MAFISPSIALVTLGVACVILNVAFVILSIAKDLKNTCQGSQNMGRCIQDPSLRPE